MAEVCIRVSDVVATDRRWLLRARIVPSETEGFTFEFNLLLII